MQTITKLDATTLTEGQKVKYGFYELTFMKVDEKEHVLLKDSDGEIRNIFKDLFEKHAKIVN